MRSSLRTSLAALLALSATACSKAPTPTPDPRLAGGSRFERDGWVYVHLEGTPGQVGFQHGWLLAPEIAEHLRVTKPYLLHETKRDWAFYRDAAEKILWPGIDEEYRAELDGIVAGLAAKGVVADRWDVVALNAIEELPGYYVPWLDQQQGQPPSTTAPGNCSAFIATGDWTTDRRIVVGHNAWVNYVTGARWNVMFDIAPASGHRILMDGLPGVIASDDDFGMNDAGIVITETTITGFSGWDSGGTPEFYRARKAMQYAASIDDFVRIMSERNNGGYANDWLVGDNKTGEIALLELGLKSQTVDRTTNGYFVGSNFPVHPEFAAAETNFDYADAGSSPNARRVRWEQLMAEHKGKIDVEAGKLFEADKYDVIEQREGPTERSLCGTIEDSPRGVPAWMQGPFYPAGVVNNKVADAAMIETMRMWAAFGRMCAPPFDAAAWHAQHPEYDWAKGLVGNLPSGPWAVFAAGETAPAR